MVKKKRNLESIIYKQWNWQTQRVSRFDSGQKRLTLLQNEPLRLLHNLSFKVSQVWKIAWIPLMWLFTNLALGPTALESIILWVLHILIVALAQEYGDENEHIPSKPWALILDQLFGLRQVTWPKLQWLTLYLGGEYRFQ